MRNRTITNQTILAGWQPSRAIYIEESTCASQPMIGTNADGLIGTGLKLSYCPCLEDRH